MSATSSTRPSTGTEPNRRIVVAYSRYKSAEAAVKEDFPETEEE